MLELAKQDDLINNYYTPFIRSKLEDKTEDYFKRLEKIVGDYKLNYYISEIDEKENRFNYTQNNDVEKIIRLIGIGDKRKKDDIINIKAIIL